MYKNYPTLVVAFSVYKMPEKNNEALKSHSWQQLFLFIPYGVCDLIMIDLVYFPKSERQQLSIPLKSQPKRKFVLKAFNDPLDASKMRRAVSNFYLM